MSAASFLRAFRCSGGRSAIRADGRPGCGPVAAYVRLWSCTNGTKASPWTRQFRDCGAGQASICLLYTSDAADEEDSVDLGGRRIIKKKKKKKKKKKHK